MSQPPLDDCLEVLADGCRRTIIQHLHDGDGETTRDELVKKLSEADGDSERAPVAIALHHNHLPKLDAYGVVKYDQDTGDVRYLSDQRIEQVLESIPEEAPTLAI